MFVCYTSPLHTALGIEQGMDFCQFTFPGPGSDQALAHEAAFEKRPRSLSVVTRESLVVWDRKAVGSLEEAVGGQRQHRAGGRAVIAKIAITVSVAWCRALAQILMCLLSTLSSGGLRIRDRATRTVPYNHTPRAKPSLPDRHRALAQCTVPCSRQQQ